MADKKGDSGVFIVLNVFLQLYFSVFTVFLDLNWFYLFITFISLRISSPAYLRKSKNVSDIRWQVRFF